MGETGSFWNRQTRYSACENQLGGWKEQFQFQNPGKIIEANTWRMAWTPLRADSQSHRVSEQRQGLQDSASAQWPRLERGVESLLLPSRSELAFRYSGEKRHLVTKVLLRGEKNGKPRLGKPRLVLRWWWGQTQLLKAACLLAALRPLFFLYWHYWNSQKLLKMPEWHLWRADSNVSCEYLNTWQHFIWLR